MEIKKGQLDFVEKILTACYKELQSQGSCLTNLAINK